MQPEIDRGKLITQADAGANGAGGYLRYQNTADGISPRALPGVPGHQHIVPTDEHDEDSVLISDEYTNPHKRRMMVEKRARKFDGLLERIPAPQLEGPAAAQVTLIGWGSTRGVIAEAIEQLARDGITANQLAIKWLVPFHADAVMRILQRAKKTVVVENNHSGQFFRYLRSETGFTANASIRKYDGEPFMPHHIADGIKKLLAGNEKIYVPDQEIMV
jgi:2-oxoglutarate ferredoxin oxidoreductase subunit alpha